MADFDIKNFADAIDELENIADFSAKGVRFSELAETQTKSDDKTSGKDKITDFGMKIGGAKKDMYSKMRNELTKPADLTEEQVIKMSFGELWPLPDYQKMSATGLEEWQIAAIRGLREAVPRKPVVNYKNRDFLHNWYRVVFLLSSTAAAVLDYRLAKDEFHDFFNTIHESSTFPYSKYYLHNYLFFNNYVYSHAYFIDGAGGINAEIADEYLQRAAGFAKLYEHFGHEKSFADCLFRKIDYFGAGRENEEPLYDNYIIGKADSSVKSGSRTVRFTPAANGESETECLENFAAVIKTADEKTDEKESKKTKFWCMIYHVDGNDGEPYKAGKYICVKKRSAVNGYVRIASLSDNVNGYEYINEHRAELEKKWRSFYAMPFERNVINKERTGEAYRTGEVTPKMFEDTFGFRGIEFGNWVTEKERQQYLDKTYDAFMDLAKAINVPPKALSLGKTLSLRFASNGTGGKNAPAAHYEPKYAAINLTKRNGAGCLAHEWFHAFDFRCRLCRYVGAHRRRSRKTLSGQNR